MSTRHFALGAILCLGLGSLLFGLRISRTQAAFETAPPSHRLFSRAAAATPTPIPSLPAGQSILTQAETETATMASVLEHGYIHSTNNRVSDTQRFSAFYSWRQHRYHDRYWFRRPTNLSKQIRHVRYAHRVVVGRWISVKAHHRWFCARQASAKKNASYWSPPRFALVNPRTIGSTQVEGHAVWHVQGRFVRPGKGYRSRLTVDVFVDQQSHLFVRATERGSLRRYGVGKSRIRGHENYTRYGRTVHAKVPLPCRS